jgi:hypothetical protein
MTLLATQAPELDPIPILRGLDPALVEESPGGTVYLIHLDRPLGVRRPRKGASYDPRHYIGHAIQGRLLARLIEHRTGNGAKFMRIARSQGITWHLARVWPGGHDQERKIKKQGGASRFCPSCGVVPAAERQKFRDRKGRYIKPVGGTS